MHCLDKHLPAVMHGSSLTAETAACCVDCGAATAAAMATAVATAVAVYSSELCSSAVFGFHLI